MPELTGFAVPPAHVRAVDFGHVLVLIDYRTGRVRGLLPAAAERFRIAARTGHIGPLHGRLADQLLTAGLLTPAPADGPWPVIPVLTAAASWGSTEHPAGIVRPGPVPISALPGGAGALAVVAAVKAVGDRGTAMNRVVRAVERAASTCRHPATPRQTEAAVRAVRAAGWHSPVRTACLEESAAVVLLLAARRLAVTWCHGIAADPVRLHAWVQTEDGAPVAEPESTLVYTPVLTIGGRHHRQS
ncbi:lasso peptide biosynthesis B2 protein [Streptomyces murinus]|uniref:lasso peptide biosynthesis B2 protein n=1 Tax=Streptomyces murinus TaxID=33900 RepID=UPI002E815099|nr:lasso peptide biosynthesis B2 protein [Streptomyces murinus]WUD07494.1 lasso peptide biosynthesis B2 protein [Streptomyces murinus]